MNRFANSCYLWYFLFELNNTIYIIDKKCLKIDYENDAIGNNSVTNNPNNSYDSWDLV